MQHQIVLSGDQVALKVFNWLIDRLKDCIEKSNNFQLLAITNDKEKLLFIIKQIEQQNIILSEAQQGDKWKNHLRIQGMNHNLVQIVKHNLMSEKSIKDFLNSQFKKFKKQGQNPQDHHFQKSQQVIEKLQNLMKQLHYINKTTIKIVLLSTFRKENLSFDKFSNEDINFLLESTQDNPNQTSLSQKIDQQQFFDVRFQNIIKMLQQQLPNLQNLNSEIKPRQKLQFFGLFMFKRILVQKDNLEEVQHIKKVWTNFIEGWLIINLQQLYQENQKSSIS